MPEMIDVPVPSVRAAEEKKKFHPGSSLSSDDIRTFGEHRVVPSSSRDHFMSASVDKIDGEGDFPRPKRDAPTAGTVVAACELNFERHTLKPKSFNYVFVCNFLTPRAFQI